MSNPAGAMALGFVTGIISALGFAYFTPFARSKLRFHDTCGVTYLHCIPGMIGGFVSAMVIDLADDKDRFGHRYYSYISFERTPREQAGY